MNVNINQATDRYWLVGLLSITWSLRNIVGSGTGLNPGQGHYRNKYMTLENTDLVEGINSVLGIPVSSSVGLISPAV